MRANQHRHASTSVTSLLKRLRRSRLVHGATAFLIAFGTVAVPVAVGLATPADAASVTLSSIQAKVSDHTGTASNYTTPDGSATDNCIKYSPSSGSGSSSTSSAFVSSPNEALTAHGYPTNGDCPNNLSTSVQSAVGVAPVAAGAVTVGVPFPLAKVTHYNNSITQRVAEYYTGNLAVQLGGFDTTPNLTFGWRMWETPNQDDPCAFPAGPNSPGCADQIQFTGQIPTQTLTKGGVTYKLVVNGFAAISNSTCPAQMPGGTTTQFLTQEGADSKACIYGTLSQVRSLKIVKHVVAPVGVTVPQTAFSFGTTSSLAGSPWNNGSYSLTPAIGSDASTSAMELLQGESVTLTEAAPANSKWSLTDLTCVDGTGQSIGTTDTGTRKVTLSNVAAPATATASPITCTYTNTYTPTAKLTLVKSVDNTGGGTAQASAWTLTATGPTPISGKTGTTAVTNATITAGQYTLTESGGATGYALKQWACTGTGATLANGNQLTLADGANATCTATNRYLHGTFKITKTVQGPAGGFTGNDDTAFPGTYSCTNGATGSFSVTHNTAWTSPDLPAGTTCTVTETAPTGHLKDSSWEWSAPAYGAGGNQVTIVDNQTPTVAITNSYAQSTGSLTITKHIGARTGAQVSDYTGSRTFPISYSCSIGGTTVKSGTVDLAKDGSTTVAGVPATSVCSLTEPTQTTQPGDFAGPDVAWDGYAVAPTSVTVVKGQTASMTLTNYLKRDTGSLVLAKTVEGAGYTGGTAKNFTVAYDCGGTNKGSVQLADGGSQTVTVPARTSCSVSETAPTGNLQAAYEWGTPTYAGLTSGSVSVPASGSATVTVTNHTVAVYGTLSVTKQVTGATQGVKNGSTFAVAVSCNAPAQGQGASYANTFTLAPNVAQSTPNLPVGTSCDVTETAPTASSLVDDSFAWGATPTKQTVTIGPKNTVKAVAVTNTVQRAYGALHVTKSVEAMGPVDGAGVTFSGTWSCQYGNDTPVTGTWSRTGSGAATMSSGADHILLASVCSVAETTKSAAPNNSDGSYVWGAPAYAPANGQVALTALAPSGQVTVTNPVARTFGAFSVSKSVTGGAAGVAFVDGDFTFHYACTSQSGEDYSGDLTAKAGHTAQLPAGVSIPSGSTCTVTETGKPDAINPFTWDVDQTLITPSNGHFTIGSQPVGVSVTNAISRKSVTVHATKALDDPDHGVTAAARFSLGLTCTLADATTSYGAAPIAAGGTADFADVPLGSVCHLTEVTPTTGLKDSSFAWGEPTFSAPQTISSTTGTYTFTATNHVNRVRGPLALTKVLTDPDHVTVANRTYAGGWTCTHPGDADVTGTWTVDGAGTATLNGLPVGGVLLESVCTPTESALTAPPSTADTSYYWMDPVLTAATTSAGKTATMQVTNAVQRHTGKLLVNKQLSGETAGYSGTGAAFTVGYTCHAKLGGQGDVTGSVDVGAGATVTLVDGVPTGWTCDVAEVAPGQALLRDISYAWGAPTVSGDGHATVGSSPATVTVTNPIVRHTGSFAITKAIAAGTPAGVVNSDATFNGSYTCTYGGQTVKQGTWTRTGAGAATLDPAATGLPATTVCSATESAPSESGLVDPSWTWATPTVSAPVTIGWDQTSTVTVTNAPQRVYAGETLTKVFDGDGNALKPGVDVAGTWSCTDGGVTVAAGSWTLPASGGTTTLFTAASSLVPVGAVCTAAENDPSGSLLVDGSYQWNPAALSPASGQVTLTREGPNAVTVTNSVSRVRGSLDIAKVVDLSEGAAKNTAATFAGGWSCRYGTDEPVTGTWAITGEHSYGISDVLVGSVCRVTSEDPPVGGPSADASYVWNGHDVSPATVTVGAASAPRATLTVTNHTRRLTTGLAITKVLTGDTAGEPTGQKYALSYACTDASGGTYDDSRLVAAGETWSTATDIPLASTCTVTEGALPDVTPRDTWAPVGFTVTGGSGTPIVEGQKVTFGLPSSAGENGPAVVGVKVANQLLRQQAGYTLTKTSDPASGTEVRPGDIVTYQVKVTATGPGTVDGVAVTDDLSDVLDNADLVGSPDTGGAGTAAVNGSTLTWDLGTVTGPAGTAYTLTYQVRVHPLAWGSVLRNHASATGEQPPTECEACTTWTEHPVAPKWTVEKSSDPVSGSTVNPDSTITYTVTVTNRSAEEALPAGTIVTDNLAAVLNNAAFTGFLPGYPGTPSISGTALTWTLPSVAPGTAVQLRYTVHVNAGANGVTLTNVVTGTGVNPPSTDCSSSELPAAFAALAAADVCVTSTTHSTPQVSAPPQVSPPQVSPPKSPKHPAVLPATGAGQLLGWAAGLGLVLTAAGVALTLRRRTTR